MELDERIAIAKSLIAKRDEIDVQLAALFSGQTPQKRQQKCGTCSAAGHRADTCPSKAKGLPQEPLQNGNDQALTSPVLVS